MLPFYLLEKAKGVFQVQFLLLKDQATSIHLQDSRLQASGDELAV